MHIHFLDPFQPRSSPIHALDARVKFVLALTFILTVALTPIGAWPVYILLLSLVLSAEVLSSLGLIYIHQRALLALPFMLAALPVIFTSGETVLISFPLGGWVLSVFLEGLERFVSVALKSWISIQAALLLASCTPFPDLLQAMRAIRIPRLLVAMFGLMWRYLFVLMDEALRLMRARAARSGRHVDGKLKPGGSLIWRAKVVGGMAGSLFLRAFDRSDRIYRAMVARGYDGETRALPMSAIRPVAWLILAASITLLIILLIFGFMFWG